MSNAGKPLTTGSNPLPVPCQSAKGYRCRILAIASPSMLMALSVCWHLSWAGIACAQSASPNSPSSNPSNASINPTGETSAANSANPNLDDQLIPAKYFIGPGDQLQVTVFGYPEYTGTQVVLSDGTISLPVVGSIKALHKTPAELAQMLTTTLNNYLVNPVVSVTITNIRPITVNVAGQVQRPGPVQLRSVTAVSNSSSLTNAGLLSLQAPTIVAALLEAGGVNRDGDIRRVVVKRFSPTGETAPFTLNLWKSLVAENAVPALILQDGDSVFVPKLADGDLLDRRLVAKSSFAPKTIRVRVVGEVKKPGELEVPPTSSLSGAIAIAGGPTDKANLGNVVFVRLNDQGQIERKTVNLNNLTDTNQVQDGDVLIIPKRFGWTALDIAAPLVTPFNFLLNLLERFETFP